MDNNATIRIRGGPVRPISPLANVVKETANLILPEGFHIYWKNVVEDTPWYRHRDYTSLIAVSSVPVNRLEKAMRLYHEKTTEILEKNRANRQKWLSHSPATETSYSCHPETGKPITDQFDDEDLDHDVYNLLETPTMMPVQDEVTSMVEQPESRPATANQPTEDVPTPQAPRRFPTFKSPRYRQEEIASQGDPTDMPELLPRTPVTTPKVTPKPSPRTTPKATPQASPNRPSPVKSSLRGGTLRCS